MQEKIITYQIKLIVKNYTTRHIKKFETALMKMVGTSGFSDTEFSSAKEIK